MSITDLVPVEQPRGVDTYRTSTDAATLCGDIVKATATKIQGKRYVTVEGWQAIAVAHGCVASSRDVEMVEGGIRAIGEIRRMSDGNVIATAEGFLGDDEQMWAKRPMFARRAMAQTRAISRACRSAFAHVVILIDRDLGTTPAEEIQGAYDHDPDSFKRPAGSMSSPKDFVDEAKRDGLTTGDDRSSYEIDKAKKITLFKDAALLAIGTSTNRLQLKAWWEENRDELKNKLPDDAYVEVYDAVQAKRDELPAIAA